jgi:hypothetical protein
MTEQLSSTQVFEQEIFRRSPITSIIVDRLATVPPGEAVTYQELSELCHCTISGASHYLRSARDILQKEHKLVFEVLRSQGLRRVPNGAIARYSNVEHLKKLRAQNGRYEQELSCVDYQKLSPEERPEYQAGLFNLAVRQTLTDKEAQKAFAVRSQQQEPLEGVKKQNLLEAIKGLWA